MSAVKYYIESSIVSKTEVTPIFNGSFSFVLEEDKLYHVHKCNSKLKFIEKDYELIIQHIDNECEDITIMVEKGCADEFTLYWQGTFKIFDTTRDDPKWLEVKPERDGLYECFEEALEDKQNLYTEEESDYVTVLSGHGEREIIECISDTYVHTFVGFGNNTPNDPLPYEHNFVDSDYPDACVEGRPNFVSIAREIHITLDETRLHDVFGTFRHVEYVLVQRFRRWTVKTSCVNGVPTPPPYPSGYAANGIASLNEWKLLQDNCAAESTAIFLSSGSTAGPYDRGRLFKDILIQMVSSLNCGLTLVSNFFDVAPDSTAPDNIAYTFANDFLKHLTLHQKSDIKRKEASNPSKELAWDIENKKAFDDLRKLFNVFPVIEGTTLRLEHYSYFENSIGWDVSNLDIRTQIDYTGNNLIRTENFYYADEACSAAFKASELQYNCGNDNKDNRCEVFSTDILFIENVNNESEISDAGFVLISNVIRDVINGQQYVAISNNAPLRWSNLLANLHLHGRLYKSGILNGEQQDFESWKPYIKALDFKVDYCCDDVWSASDKIITKLGTGTVKEAEHNIYKDKLKLNLLY